MRSCKMPSGAEMPVFGIGTWRMGESARRRPQELDAVRCAIELGYPMIDTAEMYGDGGAEEIVGEALAGHRVRPFIVSKVYPHNATRSGTIAACERSLKRMKIERIDLYLLHWRGEHPLGDTCEAMQALVAEGKIRHWGVSNFDTDDMEELAALAGDCAVNQVYYSVAERGPEFSLLPWQRGRGIPLMAYSPIDQGALAADGGLQQVAQRLGISAAQLALAWVLAQPGVAAIPKAARESHLRENLAAAALTLGPEVLAEIDSLHPAPRRKRPLAMI